MGIFRRINDMVPARVALAIISALGTTMIYMVRINLSVAIVDMVVIVSTSDASSRARTTPHCLESLEGDISNITGNIDSNSKNNLVLKNMTSSKINFTDEEFTDKLFLTSGQRGSVLAAFFYGYFLTGILGGRLAETYGSKVVLGTSASITSILTLLTPVAARTHYIALIVLRVAMGLAQGVSYPSLHAMVARWVPPAERPRFTAFVYMSSCIGVIVTMPMCGVIIDAVGWPAVFYVCGCISFLWVFLWVAFMHESPMVHPRISAEERDYILDGIKAGVSGKKPTHVPWKQMLTSLPFWATIVGHTGSMYGWNLLVTQLPTFVNSVLGFSIKSNGLLSSLPFLTRYLGGNGLSWLGDILVTRQWLQRRNSRRLFTSIGLCVPAVMLAIVGYVGCNSAAAMTILCIGTFSNGATVSGYVANQHDIAPNFAGTMLGISNMFAFGGGMLAPIVVGVLTPDQTPSQWQSAFWVATVVYALAAAFFFFCCSSDLQPWNFLGSGDAEEAKEREEGMTFLQEKQKVQVLAKKEQNTHC
ncbi:sialin-like isoform X2 [Penaeus japonicus]|uniref:sialin-like isoform X1 n=1 Tax=Penaeus japonicus TaxID=27405 RepID=UPI001C717282|nr:sialin-like isoform X1 [Penaeus japonicus]XP_042882306.1 sialin-like isoform X2 [Penaeus japonicus]